MRILVLCDDYWHPAGTPRAGLAPLEQRGWTFDWVEHAAEWSAERMREYSLVVLTKSNNVSASDRSNWVTDDVATAFVEHVRTGNGLLVVHSGCADYENQAILRGLLGGVFASHPPQCAVTIEPRTGHTLAAGVEPFTVIDEHYFLHFDDHHADVFLTTVSEHGRQPGGWTRQEGEGRVCVLTPGHNVEVWLHPSYQNILQAALHWCGGANTKLQPM